jgi:transcriptional regulator with PAS, ATPase and Fis domain
MNMRFNAPVNKIFKNLINICENIASGNYEQARRLFELTKFESYPSDIARLAEAFGLMLVKVEAREFHLETIIEKLKETQNELIQAQQQLKTENIELKQKLHKRLSFHNIIGKSRAIQDVIEKIKKTASTPFPVLITGETGTGKELIARAFHFSSCRLNFPFIAINCSAIPENLLEAELFGIEKGVATGVNKREGKIRQAHKGTIFLDEIADLSLPNQAKLLRVLEENQIEPLGGRNPIPIDVRIIAATNKDLEDEISAGRFRADLFYRLNVIHINLPALRERKDDIPLLVKHFLKTTCSRLSINIKKISPSTMEILSHYNWPGNIRELKNEIERAVALSDSDIIEPHDISPKLQNFKISSSIEKNLLVSPGTTLLDMEKALIIQTLKKTNGNKSEAARRLGITREGLRKKLKRLKISAK